MTIKDLTAHMNLPIMMAACFIGTIIITKESEQNERVRAVIIEDKRVLLIHRIKEDREYWVFPGGGVEKKDNTSHKSALKRECREELGVEVEVKELFAREVFQNPSGKDKFEFFYRCQIVGGQLGTGRGPEFSPTSDYRGKYLLEWIPRSNLKQLNVFPESVRDKLLREPL